MGQPNNTFTKRSNSWLPAAANLLKRAAILFSPFLITAVCYSAEVPNEPVVEALYQQLLERAPDPGGKAHWLQVLGQGASVKSVVQDFIHSPEYKIRFVTGHSHSDIVRGLYKHVLARPADPGGLAYWTGRLDSGVGFDQVADGFFDKEYRDLFGDNKVPGHLDLQVVAGDPFIVTQDQPSQKTFTSPDLHQGDCVMHAATVMFYPDGTGHFEAQVMTNHTMTSDIWSQTMFVKGNGGMSLFDIPTQVSPAMQTQHRYIGGSSSWYPFSYNFTFPASLYDQITTIELSCGC